jgi:MFS family permease
MSLRKIPGGVWILGLVSMFMDVSSEMIHSLLPVYLVSVMGVGATAVGVLEGVAESTVLIVKMFSGAISDRIGKRKAPTLAGYGLAAVTKPMFPLAGSFFTVFTARIMDRIGKGIRGAPRDALVADLVPTELRGASYGLRQSLDTIGALAGPLFATLLMLRTGGDFRTVFWIAVVPALVSVAMLALFVREPPGLVKTGNNGPTLHWSELRQYSPAFWWVVGVGGVFTMARFSEAFLVLRAADLGLSNSYVPLVMVVMNVVYGLSAYPAGWLSDWMDRRMLLGLGAGVLIIADVLLAQADGTPLLLAGVALWGLHMGLTQGLFAALIADTAPIERRGTAFGLFSLVSGVAMLAASVLAGGLWDRIGAPATFYAGAGFAAMALLGFLLRR